jgi:hypothetical protein
MSAPGVNPAHLRLDRDLLASDVESGVTAGFWRIIELSWPYLFVAVTAGDGHELGMRLAVDGYPAIAPAGQPWDLDTGSPLPMPLWPTGGTASQVFRHDWSPGNGNAPYMACDRVGLATHPDWANAHPQRAWNPGRTIAFYLREIHHELRGATLPQLPVAGAA